MLTTKRVLAAFIVLSGLAVMTGCPTLPDQVLSGRAGDGSSPGENIEWPGSQVDPTGEDTAGFNKVISADLNADGLLDLVTAAYESQPIQIHLQQRSSNGAISFRSLSVAGSGPIVEVSELKVADMDQDGNLDIVVCNQFNGFAPVDECATRSCSIEILFAPPDPSDALQWEEYNLSVNHRCVLVNTVPVTFSTVGYDGNDRCYASMDVADVNTDGFPDIVAALNGCDDETRSTKQVELWINPGDATIRDNETLIGSTLIDTDFDGVPDECAADVVTPWRKVLLQLDIRDIASVRFSDVDLDGDLDVMATRPDSATFDLTWQANPLVPLGSADIEFWEGGDLVELHPIGESDTGLDLLEVGDLDGDGLEDVLAITKGDRLLKWFRRPENPAAQSFPWEVYNMVQYTALTPNAMDIADLDRNGQLDVVVAADGHIRWFTPTVESPFEPWDEQFVIDDPSIPDGSAGKFAPINSVHAVDIDGDGRLDIAATLDRIGVNNDALVWFRNRPVDEE